jgi:hypothetical protein
MQNVCCLYLATLSILLTGLCYLKYLLCNMKESEFFKENIKTIAQTRLDVTLISGWLQMKQLKEISLPFGKPPFSHTWTKLGVRENDTICH